MAKLNYWERREAQDMYNYMESAEKKADEIAQLYLKASRYISTQADQIFDKYKGKYGLSESEARRLLNELKDKTSLDELLQKLRDGDSNDSRKELKKQLESAAYQARLERLRQLQNQLDFVMMRVYKQELQRNRSFYTDFANEAYYREMYNIQQRAGAAFSFAHISKDTIEEVINSRWSGENYSSRIWKNTKALAQELKGQLLLELVTGKTHREIANEIAKKYAAGASRARRLIRTESNYLAGEMSFKAYAAAGIEKYMYLAVLDLKTCTSCCRTLDGKIFYTKDKKVGVNCHPMHPWCRCTEIAVLDEEWLKDMTRKALDPKTHKKIDVPLTMSYAQWYQKYVEGNQDAKLEEKRIRNITSDRIQYKKYQEILGEEVPETLEKFQKMKYNNTGNWELFRTYTRSVKNGMISPLSGFTNYQKIYGDIEKNVIGIKTSEGIEVKGQSKHFMERVIGTMKDPKTGKPRSGVTIEGIKDALEKPLKVMPVRTSVNGNKSQKYIGKGGTVAINPDSGLLIQCNLTDVDYIRRIENAKI